MKGVLPLHHLPIAGIDLQTTQELCIHYLDMEWAYIHQVIYHASKYKWAHGKHCHFNFLHDACIDQYVDVYIFKWMSR